MKVDFQVTFTAMCDLNDAFDDYNTIMEWNPQMDPDKVIYDAIEGNLIVSNDASEYMPQSVIEEFASALRTRIGGIQMRMELE